jgi:hypothetical protein
VSVKGFSASPSCGSGAGRDEGSTSGKVVGKIDWFVGKKCFAILGAEVGGFCDRLAKV